MQLLRGVQRHLATRIFVLALLLSPLCMHAQTYGARVDAWFGSWYSAPVRTQYATLQEQDLLTRGNALDPATKGAVLRSLRSLRHALLPPGQTTAPIRLNDAQQIYLVLSGTGEARTRNASPAVLIRGCALLVPAEVSVTLHNTGSEPLTFYVLEEALPADFHPRTTLLLRDTNQLPFDSAREQWSYLVKPVFSAAEGLAPFDALSIVEMGALTIARPSLTPSPDTEIIWTTLSGDPIAFVANELRHQPPGTAFLEVPDGKTPFSAINASQNHTASFLVFSHDSSSSPLH